tara:strand:- start:305 stop:484 length:180 start_codon:yes stop_codon:yes gene_type:complete
MNMRNLKKYKICGYQKTTSGVEQILDIKEVKGILAAENITKLWEETGRFSRVVYYRLTT